MKKLILSALIALFVSGQASAASFDKNVSVDNFQLVVLDCEDDDDIYEIDENDYDDNDDDDDDDDNSDDE